ncbi:MAG: OmpA/MotB domain-containing [Prolixibacteraceae bacterium]|nr:MAG: OmpA/MotB domain-containing [Prolixibacteraceae bacterium]
MTQLTLKTNPILIKAEIIFVLVMLIFSIATNAQTNKMVDDLYAGAKKHFATKDYPGTIKICNQILSAEPWFKDAHLLLADVYGKLDSVDLEIFHLNKAGEIGREWEVVFRLGEAHFKKADYSEALRYYNIYSDYNYIDEKRRFLLACKIASCRFTIHPEYNTDDLMKQAGGNSKTDEYWPVASADGKVLIFNRMERNQKQGQREDFFTAGYDTAKWDIAKPLSDINIIDNEGIKKISDNYKIRFFTACNREDGLGDCDIYFVKFENGKWSSPVNAGKPLNTEFWEAFPSFSDDSRFLYFSSDKTGGVGNKDIWKAELLGFSDEGLPQWKEPVNLGNIINTSGNEISPVLHPKKQNIYFISDTHAGLGGLDVFEAEIHASGNVRNLQNLGYPINTFNDDPGLNISSIAGSAFFTSSRISDKGLEIFAFNLDSGLVTIPVSYVKTKVTDLVTKLSIPAYVKVENQSVKSDRIKTQQTSEKGETMFCLQLNKNYVISISEPGYLFYSNNFKPVEKNSIDKPQVLDIHLQPIVIGAEVQLYNIYYETDSFRILPQSEPELQNLVTFLKNNGQLKIEIQGHTDSSGSAQANQVLSERRAKSVVDYLAGKGIQSSRLNWGGYGDKVPIATNETPEGRTLNRRTTIKILEK